LGRTIVASREFAAHSGNAFAPIGRFDVAGFAEQQTAFGLHDEAGALQTDT
jgi:adenylate cyclase